MKLLRASALWLFLFAALAAAEDKPDYEEAAMKAFGVPDIAGFSLNLPDEEDLLGMEKQIMFGMKLGAVTYKTTDAEGKEVTKTLPKLTGQPVVGAGPLAFGLDVNWLIASESEKKLLGETGRNPVILNFVTFSQGPVYARYGQIHGMTMGSGLVLNSYSTVNTNEATVFSNKDKAIFFNYSQKADLTLFSAPELDVHGGRVGWNFGPSRDKGLSLGAFYVTDTEQRLCKGAVAGDTGVDADGCADGTTTDDTKVFGLDAKYPLGFTDLTAEWAKIQNFGSGAAVGLGFGKQAFRLDAWWRSFGKDFVPSLFDGQYHLIKEGLAGAALPLGDSPYKNGFLAKLGVAFDAAQMFQAEQGKVNFSLAYEDYERVKPRLIGEAYLRVKGGQGYMRDLKARANYIQENFRPDKAGNGTLRAEVELPVNEFLGLLVTYTQTFEDTDGDGDSEKVTGTDYSVKYTLFF